MSPDPKNADGSRKAYARAGVDIALAGRLLDGLKGKIKAASRPEVIGGVGGFGGLFDMSRLKRSRPVLVASTDSVGTKLKVASMAGNHRGVGFDIVNHCCNDVAVMGAEPLFFLDYYAADKLDPAVYRAAVTSAAKACRAARCAFLGGETAELPGVYRKNEYDLVGTIVGAAAKNRILDGSAARAGDTLVGVASNGLHTNGYSLARRIFFGQLKLRPGDRLPGSRQSVAAALLKPHLNYSLLLPRLYEKFNQGRDSRRRAGNAVFGAAHITGGGLVNNLPRALPAGCGAAARADSWPKLPVFRVLAERGGIAFGELYEVFNMGIGLVLIVAPPAAGAVIEECRALRHKAWVIGEVVAGEGRVELLRGGCGA